MRKIKYRGKRVDNGQWIYGYLCFVYIDADKARIYSPELVGSYDVYLETVGQYIGIEDKNKKEIYEGDVAQVVWYSYEQPECEIFGEVIFNNGWLSFCIWDESNKTMSEMNGQGYYTWEIEVFGNKFDNPELIGEEE